MLPRKAHVEAVLRLLRQSPVVALLGPRQVGKSTLSRTVAKHWAKSRVHVFDLEHDAHLRRLEEPSFTLAPLRGLVILDEIQRRTDLFRTLRVLADRPRTPARFLILGSASPHMLKQSAETLAGRIAFHELPGFSLDEVSPQALNRLWLRGGFPPAYMASSVAASARWRRDFIRTFVERDLPNLDVRVPSATMRRFFSMLANVHGQTLNGSELGRSMGVADTTIRHYLDILDGALVVKTLRPWHANPTKREVKSPKIYIRDSGLLHTLLDIEGQPQLLAHPRVGASWEGFAIAQLIHRLGARPDQCFFWGVHTGAELDLLVVQGKTRRGFEIKLTDAPGVTASMRTALTDLRLDSLDIIHAGSETYALAPRMRAVALSRIFADVA